MNRLFKFSVGEFYHLYNRGVEKRVIFLDDSDRIRFIKLLYLANSEKSFVFRDISNQDIFKIDRGKPIVAIGAYVLMPNHFHILVKEISEGGISKFMEKLTTGYSMYFNIKNERVGSLFQGTFKATHINTDEYLKYLYAYIHLNPINLIDSKWKENGIKNFRDSLKFIEQYKYSSYHDYVGVSRKEGIILSKEEFPDYFLDEHEFKDFVNYWIKFKNTA